MLVLSHCLEQPSGGPVSASGGKETPGHRDHYHNSPGFFGSGLFDETEKDKGDRANQLACPVSSFAQTPKATSENNHWTFLSTQDFFLAMLH